MSGAHRDTQWEAPLLCPWLLTATDPAELAERLRTTERTVRRWRRDGLPDGPTAVAFALLDGDLGAHHPAWRGWWLDPRDGCLVAPNGEAVTVGDVAAHRLERQRLRALEREVAELRAQKAGPEGPAGGDRPEGGQVVAVPRLKRS